ncbi:DNA helicase [Tanacetum coccineum]|uniref:ATP-dependent DNA helicase n=1 Tax=Tanacetum coccineum TaxID=301880 RepID=A0ABQ5FX44_9ASTR
MLRDLMSAPNVVFRGKTIVLGGDFCQTLSVKKGASKKDLIAASIVESHLWPYFKFAKWLLDVGNGEIGEPDTENEQDSSWVTILPEYTVTADEVEMSEFIDFIYDDTTLKAPTAGSLQEKEIVCPKNLTADVVNAKILSNVEGQSKTQFRTMSATTIASLRIGQENFILEAKNNTIQATMDINNIDYFSQLLKPHAAYRISNFICERTKPYQQTLENQITLRFRKITVFEPLPGKESEFPDHHFELISYHQLPLRVPYRDENSNGNIVEFTMWDDLSRQFDKREIEKLTPSIIIAASSCRVTKYKGMFRYSMRDTDILTYNNNKPIYKHRYTAISYSSNPLLHQSTDTKIPTCLHSIQRKIQLQPATLNSQVPLLRPRGRKDKKQTNVAYTIRTKPNNIQVHFTCEGMITSVRENRDWKYLSCSECRKSSTPQNGTYICEDHGRQDLVTYRRKNYRSSMLAGKTEVQRNKETGQQQFPTEIVNIISKKHIFHIHYALSTQRGAGAFIAYEVLDIQLAIQTEDAGTVVATSSATPSKETAGKEKHITGTILAISLDTTTIELTNKDKHTPGEHLEESEVRKLG